MKKTEQITVTVYYCDMCGEKIQGCWTTFKKDGEEKHACHNWIEAEETRCDLKMREELKIPIP